MLTKTIKKIAKNIKLNSFLRSIANLAYSAQLLSLKKVKID